MQTEQTEADGRRQRSEASRRRIVEAMLSLAREGIVSPSAEQVAARGDVGLRTVFRHFDNMESLYRGMHAAMLAEIGPIVERPLAGSTWQAKLQSMVEKHAELFEHIMPVRIAADVRRHASPFLAAQGAKLTADMRGALLAVLPKNLREQRDVVEALDLALSFETWRRLRIDQKLSPQRAQRVVETMVARLSA
jgi:AcrR family transcriptional regulator